MKIPFAIFCLAMLKLISIFNLQGCNEISEGLQRRQFEFLYKLNNYATMFREYTGSVNYYKDLDFYENRMKNLFEDVNRMQTVDNYGTSRVLKEKFLSLIDSNINTVNSFKMKMLLSNQYIRKEYDIIIINERADGFIEEVNDEIVRVGKE